MKQVKAEIGLWVETDDFSGVIIAMTDQFAILRSIVSSEEQAYRISETNFYVGVTFDNEGETK